MTLRQNELYEVLAGQYGPVFETIEMWACINALGVKPSKLHKLWGFRYGEIQDGICGFGETIEDAARSFYYEVRKNIG